MKVETKKCCRCQTLKALDEFWNDATRPDGLQARCKPCQRAAKRASAERKKQRQQQDGEA